MRTMWRAIALMAAACAAFVSAACQRQDLANIKTVLTNSYAALEWEDRIYAPYSAFDWNERGEQIGFVDGDQDDMVFTWTGHDPKEWVLWGRNHDGAMLMRESNVVYNPEGMISEYPWNAHLLDKEVPAQG